jgi:hypothetical protein
MYMRTHPHPHTHAQNSLSLSLSLSHTHTHTHAHTHTHSLTDKGVLRLLEKCNHLENLSLEACDRITGTNSEKSSR